MNEAVLHLMASGLGTGSQSGPPTMFSNSGPDAEKIPCLLAVIVFFL